MSQNKGLTWCIVMVFMGAAFAYTILGFGRTYDINEGQAGLYKTDRSQSIRAARSILAGDFSFYKEKTRAEFLSEEGRKYTYPPVTAVLMMPLVYLSGKVGIPGNVLFDISILPFILLSGLGVLLIASVFEEYTREDISPEGVVLVVIFLFSGMLFYSAVIEGKFEGVVAFFSLCGILFLPRRKIWSGIFFGLAICTKQISILFVIPALFVLWGEKDRKQFLLWFFSMGLTVLLILLPFLRGSGLADVYFALMKNFDIHKILDHTTIGYVYAAIRFVMGDKNGTIENFLQIYANKFVLLTSAIASLWFVWKRNVSLSTPEQYFAVTVFCSFFFIVGGKWYTAGIYEVAPTYMLVLWALAARQTLFAAVVLIVQSFICCRWPFALYKNQLLLLLYCSTIFYVLRTSFSSDRRGSAA